MKNKLVITAFLISNLALAASRPELLSQCATEAKKILKNDYFPLDNYNHKLLELTTWLSAENSAPPRQFKFTHIAKVQLQNNQLMHWDFQSITEVNKNSCRLVQQNKTGELVLTPPDDCENCDDNQD